MALRRLSVDPPVSEILQLDLPKSALQLLHRREGSLESGAVSGGHRAAVWQATGTAPPRLCWHPGKNGVPQHRLGVVYGVVGGPGVKDALGWSVSELE